MITRITLALIAFIKTTLCDAFEMSDLGLLKQFMGIEISQYFNGIMVTQSKYIADLLIEFRMVNFKATPFPFLSRIRLEEGKKHSTH